MQSKKRNKAIKPATEAERVIRELGGESGLVNLSADAFRLMKSPVQKIVLDRYWSWLVKFRAGFVCEISGKTERLNAHHLVNKHYGQKLRWHLKNAICITWYQHNYRAHSDDYDTATAFREDVKRLRGETIYDELELLKRGTVTDRIGLLLHFQDEHRRVK